MAGFPVRRALQDISSSPFFRRGTDTDSNLFMSHDAYTSPSPEEQIIQQRSRVKFIQSLQCQFDNQENDADFLKTPCKDFTFSGLSRKRLQLTPEKDFTDSGPPKAKKVCERRQLSASLALSSQLQTYNTQQLVEVIEKLVSKHPALGKEICANLPHPDLRHLESILRSLRRKILKALPTSRLGTGRDAVAFKRVKLHLQAFKKSCLDQGRSLLLRQCWSSHIKYVLLAWKYVCQLPQWDNPSHNECKSNCFRGLAAQVMVTLKQGAFNKHALMEIKTMFVHAAQMSTELDLCLKEIDRLLMNNT